MMVQEIVTRITFLSWPWNSSVLPTVTSAKLCSFNFLRIFWTC